MQVGRNALPLFNAGLVGTQRQTLYLRTSPLHDVTNFGADVLFPVLVRDAEALGIYKALGVPATRPWRRSRDRALDIINAINLGRPIPVADGFTGDVITLDAAIDSSFPERPAAWRRDRAEPQSGEREQRAHQPDRRGAANT